VETAEKISQQQYSGPVMTHLKDYFGAMNLKVVALPRLQRLSVIFSTGSGLFRPKTRQQTFLPADLPSTYFGALVYSLRQEELLFKDSCSMSLNHSRLGDSLDSAESIQFCASVHRSMWSMVSSPD
jgi:hypothetical protein